MELVGLRCKECKTEFFTKFESGNVTCPNCQNSDRMTITVGNKAKKYFLILFPILALIFWFFAEFYLLPSWLLNETGFLFFVAEAYTKTGIIGDITMFVGSYTGVVISSPLFIDWEKVYPNINKKEDEKEL